MPPTTYQITDLGDPGELLFFDIETTGFRARSSSLYLIGLMYFEDQSLIAEQLFADTPDEEPDLLKQLLSIIPSYRIILHFNGNTFDIPYLNEKCKQYGLPSPFDNRNGVDLYRRIAGFKNILHLENCRQKTLESFMGIHREDSYTGGELISIYEDYVQCKDSDSRSLLLLHNLEDLEGMYRLLPILSYPDLLLIPFRVVKVVANVYYGNDGCEQNELVIKMKFHSCFPHPIAIHKNQCHFSGEDQNGFIKVPLRKGTVKYFYPNYRDYYYLPYEDVALHKSVASFVDKQFREQASARTCYTKKSGSFLPQWDILFEPYFKTDYDNPLLYFELTEEMKRQPELFRKYALHLLDMLIHAKEK